MSRKGRKYEAGTELDSGRDYPIRLLIWEATEVDDMFASGFWAGVFVLLTAIGLVTIYLENQPLRRELPMRRAEP